MQIIKKSILFTFNYTHIISFWNVQGHMESCYNEIYVIVCDNLINMMKDVDFIVGMYDLLELLRNVCNPLFLRCARVICIKYFYILIFKTWSLFFYLICEFGLT